MKRNTAHTCSCLSQALHAMPSRPAQRLLALLSQQLLFTHTLHRQADATWLRSTALKAPGGVLDEQQLHAALQWLAGNQQAALPLPDALRALLPRAMQRCVMDVALFWTFCGICVLRTAAAYGPHHRCAYRTPRCPHILTGTTVLVHGCLRKQPPTRCSAVAFAQPPMAVPLPPCRRYTKSWCLPTMLQRRMRLHGRGRQCCSRRCGRWSRG